MLCPKRQEATTEFNAHSFWSEMIPMPFQFATANSRKVGRTAVITIGEAGFMIILPTCIHGCLSKENNAAPKIWMHAKFAPPYVAGTTQSILHAYFSFV